MNIWFLRLFQTIRKTPVKYYIQDIKHKKVTKNQFFDYKNKLQIIRRNMNKYSQEGGGVLAQVRPRERDKNKIDPLDTELENEFEHFKYFLEEQNKQKLPLEDSEYSFATGTAKFCDGYITDPTSLKMIATYVYQNGGRKCYDPETILGEFHMQTLMAKFNNFTAQESGRRFTGGIELKVPDNRIYISYVADNQSGRRSAFRLSNDIVVAKLGHLQVNVFGSLLFNRMIANKLVPVVNTRKETTTEVLEKSIYDLLTEYKRTWAIKTS